MKPYTVGLVVVLVAFTLAACAQESTREPVAQPATSEEPQNEAKPDNQSEAYQTITVEAYQFGWDPNPIRVEQGRPVKLKLRSRDVKHGIRIPSFNVEKDIPGSGETVIAEFTPDQAGSFTFSCSVYCGTGHAGMTGELIVES